MKYQGVTIHKNKNCNTWFTRYRNIDGKQIYISAKTQQQCYDKLKIEINKKHKLLLNPPKQKEESQITLLEWYNQWLKLYKQNVKTTTIKEYNIALKHLNSLKNCPINQITSIQIIEELNNISGERQRQKTYEFLKGLYQKAELNELITKNPINKIEKPKHKKVNGKALTNSDEKKLEEILIKNNLDMFLICLYQGLRRSEMLALTIEDIDFNNKTMRINKSLNKQNQFDTTKNLYSNRVMPIFDKSMPILEKYKNTTGRIFNITQGQSELFYRKVIKELGTNYTIHSLRHTFITKCQELNIPLHIIQKWVGHNIGSSVTNAVYTHTRDNAELENIKKLNSNSTQ